MTSWVLRLIVANVIVFMMTSARPAMSDALMFVPALILSKPWTIVTYMFLHGGFSHILFNMVGLFFFGPRLEIEIGGKQFLWLYFISGIMGALLSFVFNPYTAIIGASGAVYGVMLGFAFFWPREKIYVWGVLPVEARIMVLAMTALSLFGGFSGSGDGTAHFAHLGGFVGGFIYLKTIHRSFHVRRVVSEMSVPAPRQADIARWASIPRERLHEVNREELDRIRTKINSSGVESLTMTEIAFLDRFSQQ